jgi:hypothetical protein
VRNKVQLGGLQELIDRKMKDRKMKALSLNHAGLDHRDHSGLLRVSRLW